ncbi:hypothetical protein [Pontibacter flavimaris]|uniref:Uncharacterized protein n=1 Tax=Pontibacter flavimaris TaxID=1797110 RepID=A0A1Q5P8S5_9BACT|nr:hypothetical protein [Pontibacter flavimaris]OKL38645.1 hypothetical protein A3841_05750 [Pontibacter flavimaris]
MKQTLLPLLASILFLCSGCEKEEDTSATVETVDATLVWMGDYAVDGCGYMLRIGEMDHKPLNEEAISSSYREDSPTEVEVRIINFHKKERFCMAGIEINTVKILELRRR